MTAAHAKSSVADVAAPASKWMTGLTPEMPLSEALPQILKQRWQGVLQGVPVACENGEQEPESVHKLRVACRRMDAVLNSFAKAISKKARRCTLRLLGRIRRICGTARDLDVQLAFLAKLISQIPAEANAGVRVIHEQLLRRRGLAQEKLRSRLESLTSKLQRCEQRLLEPGGVRQSRHGREPFGSACASILNAEIRKIRDETGEEVPSAKALHQLRVECKKLRYGAEISANLLHESFRDELYPQLQRVQDLLGSWNDAVLTEANLSQLRKKWKQRRDDEGQCELIGSDPIAWQDLQFGFAVARQACREQAETALLEFRGVWPDFVGKSFCQPVEELLTSMEQRAATEEAECKTGRCRPRRRLSTTASK